MGGGLAAIIGEMGETGRFWTYPISITVGVLVAYFCLFSPIWANLRRKYKAIDLIGKFGMLPAIIIGVVLGPIVKEIAVPAVQLWPLIKIPEFGNIWLAQRGDLDCRHPHRHRGVYHCLWRLRHLGGAAPLRR